MYAWVEIDTRDIDTADLIDELKRRDKNNEWCSDMMMNSVIARLKELKCPPTLIEQLQAWWREPFADGKKLMAWLDACGVNNSPK